MAKKSDIAKGGYSARSGGGRKQGHPIGPATKESSTIATKQRLGKQVGTGRKGFLHLPVEGAPRSGDHWRGG